VILQYWVFSLGKNLIVDFGTFGRRARNCIDSHREPATDRTLDNRTRRHRDSAVFSLDISSFRVGFDSLPQFALWAVLGQFAVLSVAAKWRIWIRWIVHLTE